MARSIVPRLCVLACLAVPVAAQSVIARSGPEKNAKNDTASDVPYERAGSLPDMIGGQRLSTFAFDRSAQRLYAGSWLGLYWVDVTDARPVWKGPMFKSNIRHIEFAPEVRRVFYMTMDDVGYVDVDALEAPHSVAKISAQDIAYEPSRRELYIASFRSEKLQVFDARSGEHSGSIQLPGWYATSLEAIPGRVFMQVASKDGLFAVDATSHKVGAWPVSGKIVTPAHLEADPDGRYLFLTYYQNVVVIDPATARVVGRISSGATPSIAFDPGRNLLVTAFKYGTGPEKLGVYRVDAAGLTEVSEIKNPAIGLPGVEQTNNGFLQRAHHSLLIWTARSPR